LPHNCNSWVLVQRETGLPVTELFSKRNADKLAATLATEPDAARRYELLTAADYLVRFNASVRASA
jgi:hypothetical protein